MWEGVSLVAGAVLGLVGVRLVPPVRPTGADELVPYWRLTDSADGVVQKDGGLLTVYELDVPADAAMTTAELESLHSALVEAMRDSMGPGRLVIHLHWMRRRGNEYLEDHGRRQSAWAAWSLDEIRRRRFSLGWFDDRRYLTVAYFPPEGTQQAIDGLFVRGRRSRAEIGHRAVRGWRDCLDRVESGWSRARGLRLDRLKGPSLTSFLAWVVRERYQEVGVPSLPLDTLLAQSILSGRRPRVGGQHIRVLGFRDFPEETWMGLVGCLEKCSFPFRLSIRFLPLHPEEVESALRRWQRRWNASVDRNPLSRESKDADKRNEARALKNLAAARARDELGELSSEATLRGVPYGAFGAWVILTGESEAEVESRAREAESRLREARVVFEPEQDGSLSALRASWPGNASCYLRRPLVSARQLFHACPITGQWAGSKSLRNAQMPKETEPLAWCLSRSGTVVGFSLYPSADVGHTMVVGATGGGKSVLLSFLAIQYFQRYQASGSRVFIVDRARSQEVVTRACGGRWSELGAGATGMWQPLRKIEVPQARARIETWLASSMEGWLAEPLTPAQRRDLGDSLSLLARRDRDERTMSALRELVQENALKEGLLPFTSGNVLGALDGIEARVDGGDDFETVEVGRLDELEERYADAAIALVMQRVLTGLDGRPTLLIFEEAGRLMGDPRWERFVLDCLEQLRKQNVAVVLAMQNIAQVLERERGLDALARIRSSCASLLVLPDAHASEHGRLYEAVGLNGEEIAFLQTLDQRRHYYWHTSEGRGAIDLALTEEQLRFLGTPAGDAQTTKRRVQATEADENREWGQVWFERLSRESAASAEAPGSLTSMPSTIPTGLSDPNLGAMK